MNLTSKLPLSWYGMLLAILLTTPLQVHALSSDRDQPMSVEADRANIDNKNEISIYLGNVIVVQGSMRITADKLTVHSRNKAVEKVIAEGEPATFKQRPDGKELDVKGKALRIEYYADTDNAIFIEQAVLEQEGNTFRSNRIVYDLTKDLVDAGTPSGGDRVKIILQPREKQDKQ
jgi:lipopolysaccharide export system protein LptA